MTALQPRQHRVDRTLREAARLHRDGKLAAAEAAYRRILAQQPAHPGALHGFGLLALQAGRADIAIGTIGQAARLVPDSAAYHLDLGLALRLRGHLEDARAAFHVAALLDPADPTPTAAMADMLARLDRLEEAAAAYRLAIALSPPQADLSHALGLVLRADGRLHAATEALAAAVALAPDQAAMRNDLAGALLAAGSAAAAEVELRAALDCEPGHVGALNNLGLALQDLEQPDAALAAFLEALRLAPGDPDIRNNLGVAWRDLDRNAEALDCFDAVLAGHPDHAAAHLNAASVLLMQGDFARGWAEFAWRDRVAGGTTGRFSQPAWQGEPLGDRVLLVHAEMGFGDTIQFCRFVSGIEGRVLLQVPPPLARLLDTLPGGARVISGGTAEPFDLHCPLPSLPQRLGVTMAELSGDPYLHADPAAVAHWRTRLAELPGRSVGICWAGSTAYVQDRRRSLPAAQLAALAKLAALAEQPGLSLVSLQRDGRPPMGLPIVDWTADLTDFADTAALVTALDLVVSVDTAVAHLAGALGRPVVLLDRFAGDWRWGRGRVDSPWYAGMRIVRQPAPGDWTSVLAELATLLS